MKVFGRELAVWVALVSACIQVLTSFGIDVSPEWQAIITAIVTAAFGLIVAVMVGDGIIAAALGFVQSAISLFVGLGLDWSGENQAKFMGALALILGYLTRQNVVAPISAAEVSGPVTVNKAPADA